MSHLKPFQLLEINVISAQDLHLVSKNMRTYAVAWVHPKHKLSTSVDAHGHNNPTWNDKFVFRVDDEFLRLDMSAVMIEIYGVRWFRDTLVGTVRILVGNLVPPSTRPNHHHHHHIGMRFAALQVRRPSGRPQGILNIGVAVLNSSMRSMPLYNQIRGSAVGYRTLMEEDHHHDNNNNHTSSNASVVKPILRRSRSEHSERTFDDFSSISGSIVAVPQKKGRPGNASSSLSSSESSIASKEKGKKGEASSLFSSSESSIASKENGEKGKASVWLSSSESSIASKEKGKKVKASSVINGAELREEPKERGKKGKASSFINVSIISKDSHKEKEINVKKIGKQPSLNPPPKDKVSNEEHNVVPTITTDKQADEKPPPSAKNKEMATAGTIKPASGKAISKFKGYELGGPKGSSIVNGKYIYGGAPPKAHSFLSDSEVGPSPSEVAAAMARERYLMDDNQSSVLDGWSLDESVEGLRSKLERWRTELPPLYDRRGGGEFESSSFRSTSQYIQRNIADDGSKGPFSCFGSIYGYECQCVCGKPPEGRRSLSGQFQSPSASVGRSFL